MKFKRSILAVCAASVVLASGCATVTRGTTEAWSVTTVPAGATVSLSNGERCTSPCTVKLKRKFPFNVHVCKAGFEPIETQVESQVAGSGAAGMAGNVIVGGLIGIGVDAASGATKELVPNPLAVTLNAGTPGCEAPVFPPVPEDGQTPEEYLEWRDK